MLQTSWLTQSGNGVLHSVIPRTFSFLPCHHFTCLKLNPVEMLSLLKNASMYTTPVDDIISLIGNIGRSAGGILNGDIKSELKKLEEMLRTAHRHRRADRELANLAYELFSISDDARNVIDITAGQSRYTYDCSSRMDKSCISTQRFLFRCASVEYLGRIRRRISDIERTVTNCLERLGIPLSDTATIGDDQEQYQSAWRPSHKFGNNMETFDVHFSEIREKLLHRHGNDTGGSAMRQTTIRIVGMGGLGKTDLAKRICEDYRIRNHFRGFLWPKPSENISPIEAIKRILMLIRTTDEGDEIRDDMETLLDVLRRSLYGKRYLFVLDGATNTSGWDFLLSALLSCGMGENRILITTRSIYVAPYATTHQLQLTDEDGWELFKSKLPLPPNDADAQVQLLEDYGREILSFCMGLPSIISSVATSLSRAEPEHWLSERDSLKGDLHESLDTAAASLPRSLQQCLYYFVLFGKGSDIPARRLINLLVAEGMVIPFSTDFPLEAIAEAYLSDLVELNWIQVVVRKPNGKVKTYRMHPLLMDYWLLKAQEAKFMDEKPWETNEGTVADLSGDVRPTASTIRSSVTRSLRRLAAATKDVFVAHPNQIPAAVLTLASLVELILIQLFIFDDTEVRVHRFSDHLVQHDPNHAHIHQYNSTGLAKFLVRYQKLRCFLSFDSREGSEPGEEIGNFLKRGIRWLCFQNMKVLDLERVFRPELPKSIGELIHLRYLGLRWTYLKELPSSIHKLLLLHTLDLKHTYISELPRSLWMMKQLRNLYLSESYRSRFAPPPRSIYLTHLQTLWGAFLDGKIYSQLQQSLFQLKEIRKLGLTYRRLTLDEQKAPTKWITEKLRQLETLRLISIDDKVEPFDLYIEPLSGLDKLSSIYLLGKLAGSPLALNTFPVNLTELTLSFSRLETDPMPILEKLPNLRVLGLLCNSFMGISMSCSLGGFPVLQKLMLWNLNGLKTWTVTRGALRWLKELDIRSCAALEEVPEGLEHLELLVKLNIVGMPIRFTSKVENGDGVDWWKIAHVQDVKIEDSPGQQQSGGN